MSAPARTPLLSPALTAVGLVFTFGIITLNRLWPSGWAWQPEQPAYLHMILSIYVTLGIFLLVAARDPARHLGLIWFTIWSSVAHATAMAVHSVADTGQMGHLWGDVAALYLTAAVLALLVRRDLPGARLL
jgi:FtsH-binding integral membrane protein